MSLQKEKKKQNPFLIKAYFWESPSFWLFLIFFLWFLVKINFISIKSLAISSQTLRDSFYYYTLFSAGISHKSFFHLLFNMIFLIGLYLFSIKENFYASPKNFIQLALFINLIQGFLLSLFLFYENSFQKYIYGSSGMVCGIASFFLFEFLKKKKKISPLLKISLILIFIFSIIDLFYFPSYSLGSLSHLIGLFSGFILSCTRFQREVLFP